MNAQEVIQNLRAHFSAPAFCFLEQVADGTGARQHRWADAVAMSVWPSRGYDIHGIEVKVSRYDWKKELDQPKKSEAVQQYCNRWWIATPDDSIIQPGELPSTWGWMIVAPKVGMKVLREAPALTPKAISIEFLASVLRNVQKADETEIEKRIRKAENEARNNASEYLQKQVSGLKREVQAFEAASGIRINEYTDGKELGEAVKTLRQLKWRLSSITGAIQACTDIQQMLHQVQILAELKETPNGVVHNAH